VDGRALGYELYAAGVFLPPIQPGLEVPTSERGSMTELKIENCRLKIPPPAPGLIADYAVQTIRYPAVGNHR
jgi:hypothetical protein